MTMASVQWTFARRIGLGFTIAVVLTIAIGGVAVFGLRRAVASKDEVIMRDAQLLVQAERLRAWFEAKSSHARGYLLSRDPAFLDKLREAKGGIGGVHRELQQLIVADAGHELLAAVERADAEYQEALDRVIALRGGEADLSAVERSFEELVLPRRERVDAAVRALIDRGERVLEEGRTASNRAASSAISLVILIAGLAALFCTGVALLLSRWLGRQIGTAVSQVQSSSAELQSSANQQATGSKEQVTAMNEITTTISELLATSRQIAESSVRVAQIAEETAGAAHSGEGTVERAQGSLGGIRRQVDLVVNHMLELGKKSQQIGSVLDIVSELAEQTNILAINATIEAAGAGEAGKRFAVVADEIRKLADRVTGSAKEIRGLIDEVRGAVNTTVMATETVSKAVDAGSRQFTDVVGSLKQIAGMVVTTTQAAREIELSTKQQSTAVEQVNIAITNVAQASRESETSTTQTLQTASQLASLSRDLLRLVEPQAIARA
jgi:methyl-accepting chemotaxis protein